MLLEHRVRFGNLSTESQPTNRVFDAFWRRFAVNNFPLKLNVTRTSRGRVISKYNAPRCISTRRQNMKFINTQNNDNWDWRVFVYKLLAPFRAATVWFRERLDDPVRSTLLHVLYVLPIPICCRFLVSVQLLPPVVSASLPPQFGTLSLLPSVIPLQRTLSVAFIRLTTSSRPSAIFFHTSICVLRKATIR